MDEARQEERAQRISAVFALLTAKLEDATGLAADGQAPNSDECRSQLAVSIAQLSAEVATIASLIVALMWQGQRPDSKQG